MLQFPSSTRPLHYGNLVNRDSPLNRGLVSWWLTLPQRGKGNTWFDIAGTRHATLTTSPEWRGSLGRPGGNGSLFSSSAPHALTSGNPLLGASAFTLAAWTNVPNVGFDGSLAISNTDVGSSGDQYRIVHDGAASAKWMFLKAVAFASTSILADAATTANVWTHVCATCDAAGALLLYVNGVLQAATGTRAGTFTAVTNTELVKSAASRSIYGDDLRIWNRGLTASEVGQVYDDSRRGCHKTLNRVRGVPLVNAAAGGGGGNRRRRVIIGGTAA